VALSFLASPEGEAEVMAAYAKTSDLGIHSIPTLVLDGRFVVNGAAKAGEIEEALRSLGADGAPPTGQRLFGDCLAF
jgi:predicted DsbA family dithiol-disulfide isomerase